MPERRGVNYEIVDAIIREGILRGYSPQEIASILSIAAIESDFNPRKLGDYVQGKPTSYGLFQINQSRFSSMGLSPKDTQKLLDWKFQLPLVFRQFDALRQKIKKVAPQLVRPDVPKEELPDIAAHTSAVYYTYWNRPAWTDRVLQGDTEIFRQVYPKVDRKVLSQKSLLGWELLRERWNKVVEELKKEQASRLDFARKTASQLEGALFPSMKGPRVRMQEAPPPLMVIGDIFRALPSTLENYRTYSNLVGSLSQAGVEYKPKELRKLPKKPGALSWDDIKVDDRDKILSDVLQHMLATNPTASSIWWALSNDQRQLFKHQLIRTAKSILGEMKEKGKDLSQEEFERILTKHLVELSQFSAFRPQAPSRWNILSQLGREFTYGVMTDIGVMLKGLLAELRPNQIRDLRNDLIKHVKEIPSPEANALTDVISVMVTPSGATAADVFISQVLGGFVRTIPDAVAMMGDFVASVFGKDPRLFKRWSYWREQFSSIIQRRAFDLAQNSDFRKRHENHAIQFLAATMPNELDPKTGKPTNYGWRIYALSVLQGLIADVISKSPQAQRLLPKWYIERISQGVPGVDVAAQIIGSSVLGAAGASLVASGATRLPTAASAAQKFLTRSQIVIGHALRGIALDPFDAARPYLRTAIADKILTGAPALAEKRIIGRVVRGLFSDEGISVLRAAATGEKVTGEKAVEFARAVRTAHNIIRPFEFAFEGVTPGLLFLSPEVGDSRDYTSGILAGFAMNAGFGTLRTLGLLLGAAGHALKNKKPFADAFRAGLTGFKVPDEVAMSTLKYFLERTQFTADEAVRVLPNALGEMFRSEIATAILGAFYNDFTNPVLPLVFRTKLAREKFAERIQGLYQKLDDIANNVANIRFRKADDEFRRRVLQLIPDVAGIWDENAFNRVRSDFEQKVRSAAKRMGWTEGEINQFVSDLNKTINKVRGSAMYRTMRSVEAEEVRSRVMRSEAESFFRRHESALRELRRRAETREEEIQTVSEQVAALDDFHTTVQELVERASSAPNASSLAIALEDLRVFIENAGRNVGLSQAEIDETIERAFRQVVTSRAETAQAIRARETEVEREISHKYGMVAALLEGFADWQGGDSRFRSDVRSLINRFSKLAAGEDVKVTSLTEAASYYNAARTVYLKSRFVIDGFARHNLISPETASDAIRKIEDLWRAVRSTVRNAAPEDIANHIGYLLLNFAEVVSDVAREAWAALEPSVHKDMASFGSSLGRRSAQRVMIDLREYAEKVLPFDAPIPDERNVMNANVEWDDILDWLMRKNTATIIRVYNSFGDERKIQTPQDLTTWASQPERGPVGIYVTRNARDLEEMLENANRLGIKYKTLLVSFGDNNNTAVVMFIRPTERGTNADESLNDILFRFLRESMLRRLPLESAEVWLKHALPTNEERAKALAGQIWDLELTGRLGNFVDLVRDLTSGVDIKIDENEARRMTEIIISSGLVEDVAGEIYDAILRGEPPESLFSEYLRSIRNEIGEENMEAYYMLPPALKWYALVNYIIGETLAPTPQVRETVPNMRQSFINSLVTLGILHSLIGREIEGINVVENTLSVWFSRPRPNDIKIIVRVTDGDKIVVKRLSPRNYILHIPKDIASGYIRDMFSMTLIEMKAATQNISPANEFSLFKSYVLRNHSSRFEDENQLQMFMQLVVPGLPKYTIGSLAHPTMEFIIPISVAPPVRVMSELSLQLMERIKQLDISERTKEFLYDLLVKDVLYAPMMYDHVNYRGIEFAENVYILSFSESTLIHEITHSFMSRVFPLIHNLRETIVDAGLIVRVNADDVLPPSKPVEFGRAFGKVLFAKQKNELPIIVYLTHQSTDFPPIIDGIISYGMLLLVRGLRDIYEGNPRTDAALFANEVMKVFVGETRALVSVDAQKVADLLFNPEGTYLFDIIQLVLNGLDTFPIIKQLEDEKVNELRAILSSMFELQTMLARELGFEDRRIEEWPQLMVTKLVDMFDNDKERLKSFLSQFAIQYGELVTALHNWFRSSNLIHVTPTSNDDAFFLNSITTTIYASDYLVSRLRGIIGKAEMVRFPLREILSQMFPDIDWDYPDELDAVNSYFSSKFTYWKRHLGKVLVELPAVFTGLILTRPDSARGMSDDLAKLLAYSAEGWARMASRNAELGILDRSRVEYVHEFSLLAKFLVEILENKNVHVIGSEIGRLWSAIFEKYNSLFAFRNDELSLVSSAINNLVSRSTFILSTVRRTFDRADINPEVKISKSFADFVDSMLSPTQRRNSNPFTETMLENDDLIPLVFLSGWETLHNFRMSGLDVKSATAFFRDELAPLLREITEITLLSIPTTLQLLSDKTGGDLRKLLVEAIRSGDVERMRRAFSATFQAPRWQYSRRVENMGFYNWVQVVSDALGMTLASLSDYIRQYIASALKLRGVEVTNRGIDLIYDALRRDVFFLLSGKLPVDVESIKHHYYLFLKGYHTDITQEGLITHTPQEEVRNSFLSWYDRYGTPLPLLRSERGIVSKDLPLLGDFTRKLLTTIDMLTVGRQTGLTPGLRRLIDWRRRLINSMDRPEEFFRELQNMPLDWLGESTTRSEFLPQGQMRITFRNYFLRMIDDLAGKLSSEPAFLSRYKSLVNQKPRVGATSEEIERYNHQVNLFIRDMLTSVLDFYYRKSLPSITTAKVARQLAPEFLEARRLHEAFVDAPTLWNMREIFDLPITQFYSNVIQSSRLSGYIINATEERLAMLLQTAIKDAALEFANKVYPENPEEAVKLADELFNNARNAFYSRGFRGLAELEIPVERDVFRLSDEQLGELRRKAIEVIAEIPIEVERAYNIGVNAKRQFAQEYDLVELSSWKIMRRGDDVVLGKREGDEIVVKTAEDLPDRFIYRLIDNPEITLVVLREGLSEYFEGDVMEFTELSHKLRTGQIDLDEMREFLLKFNEETIEQLIRTITAHTVRKLVEAEVGVFRGKHLSTDDAIAIAEAGFTHGRRRGAINQWVLAGLAITAAVFAGVTHIPGIDVAFRTFIQNLTSWELLPLWAGVGIASALASYLFRWIKHERLSSYMNNALRAASGVYDITHAKDTIHRGIDELVVNLQNAGETERAAIVGEMKDLLSDDIDPTQVSSELVNAMIQTLRPSLDPADTSKRNAVTGTGWTRRLSKSEREQMAQMVARKVAVTSVALAHSKLYDTLAQNIGQTAKAKILKAGLMNLLQSGPQADQELFEAVLAYRFFTRLSSLISKMDAEDFVDAMSQLGNMRVTKLMRTVAGTAILDPTTGKRKRISLPTSGTKFRGEFLDNITVRELWDALFTGLGITPISWDALIRSSPKEVERVFNAIRGVIRANKINALVNAAPEDLRRAWGPTNYIHNILVRLATAFTNQQVAAALDTNPILQVFYAANLLELERMLSHEDVINLLGEYGRNVRDWVREYITQLEASKEGKWILDEARKMYRSVEKQVEANLKALFQDHTESGWRKVFDMASPIVNLTKNLRGIWRKVASTRAARVEVAGIDRTMAEAATFPIAAAEERLQSAWTRAVSTPLNPKLLAIIWNESIPKWIRGMSEARAFIDLMQMTPEKAKSVLPMRLFLALRVDLENKVRDIAQREKVSAERLMGAVSQWAYEVYTSSRRETDSVDAALDRIPSDLKNVVKKYAQEFRPYIVHSTIWAHYITQALSYKTWTGEWIYTGTPTISLFERAYYPQALQAEGAPADVFFSDLMSMMDYMLSGANEQIPVTRFGIGKRYFMMERTGRALPKSELFFDVITNFWRAAVAYDALVPYSNFIKAAMAVAPQWLIPSLARELHMSIGSPLVLRFKENAYEMLSEQLSHAGEAYEFIAGYMPYSSTMITSRMAKASSPVNQTTARALEITHLNALLFNAQSIARQTTTLPFTQARLVSDFNEPAFAIIPIQTLFRSLQLAAGIVDENNMSELERILVRSIPALRSRINQERRHALLRGLDIINKLATDEKYRDIIKAILDPTQPQVARHDAMIRLSQLMERDDSLSDMVVRFGMAGLQLLDSAMVVNTALSGAIAYLMDAKAKGVEFTPEVIRMAVHYGAQLAESVQASPSHGFLPVVFQHPTLLAGLGQVFRQFVTVGFSVAETFARLAGKVITSPFKLVSARNAHERLEAAQSLASSLLGIALIELGLHTINAIWGTLFGRQLEEVPIGYPPDEQSSDPENIALETVAASTPRAIIRLGNIIFASSFGKNVDTMIATDVPPLFRGIYTLVSSFRKAKNVLTTYSELSQTPRGREMSWHQRLIEAYGIASGLGSKVSRQAALAELLNLFTLANAFSHVGTDVARSVPTVLIGRIARTRALTQEGAVMPMEAVLPGRAGRTIQAIAAGPTYMHTTMTPFVGAPSLSGSVPEIMAMKQASGVEKSYLLMSRLENSSIFSAMVATQEWIRRSVNRTDIVAAKHLVSPQAWLRLAPNSYVSKTIKEFASLKSPDDVVAFVRSRPHDFVHMIIMFSPDKVMSLLHPNVRRQFYAGKELMPEAFSVLAARRGESNLPFWNYISHMVALTKERNMLEFLKGYITHLEQREIMQRRLSKVRKATRLRGGE